MKNIKLLVLFALNSIFCLSQVNTNISISFRNFILDKTSYEDCINILKSKGEFKYKKIIEYSNGYYYWVKDDQKYPSSGFADKNIIEKFSLRNYDTNLKMKSISCRTDLLESECEMQLYFYSDTLCAIAINLINMTLDFQLEQQLDEKYGERHIHGFYDYPNIKEDWHTTCTNWCYKGEKCENAPISISELYNVCDIFKVDNIGFLSTNIINNVLSYRGKSYNIYLDYKNSLNEKAKNNLELLKKQKKYSI